MADTADCWRCRHSTGMDPATAEVTFVRDRGWGNDHGDPKQGVSIICMLRRRINARPRSTPGKPCEYEREPGT